MSFLRIPEEKVSLDPINFSVEAGLVHRLGEESVSDPVLSVVELVKNSYDDDAETVNLCLRNIRTGKSTIVVTDNGHGMTDVQLQLRWMKIATSIKAREPISPTYKRHRLGQKGVGRFAVENLSRKTVLISLPRGSVEGYEIIFDWDKYKPGMNIQDVPNNFSKFKKEPEEHGLQIQLLDLRYRWTEEHVKLLQTYLKALTPPALTAPHFTINFDSDEFAELKGVVDSDFLNKAVFKFEASLAKTGDIEYSLTAPTKKDTKVRTEKLFDFACGPIKIILYFYYRERSRMASYGINIGNIDDFKRILDDYGGIKIYRDGIRLSGFGNPGDDWTGLDTIARNDPTVFPGKNQVIATVEITSKDNPEITETTTRENLIRNRSFQDMLEFIHKSIAVFAQLRGEIEAKRQPINQKGQIFVKKAMDKIKENRDRKPLLDFVDRYPAQVFYKRLEEEINICYVASLPNASMMLSRKLVENLLYEILDCKFPRNPEIRFNTVKGRALDFSVLIDNFETKRNEFGPDIQEIIDKLLVLIKPFRRDANSKTHKVIEYLDTLDELDKHKVPEIVELELQILKKAHMK